MTSRDVALKLATNQSRLNFIGGAYQEVPESDCFPVIDPARDQRIGVAPESSADVVNAAVQAADEAFGPWSAMPPLERSRLLLQAACQLEGSTEEIAALISLETGRPIRSETRPEVVNALKIFRYFAGLALESKGDSFLYAPDVLALTVREPLGVVGAITPWNVPAMLFCLKVAPALVTGNTVVVKPAEQSPLSTMLLTRSLAGNLPAGVLNVVNGHGESTGQSLVRHDAVRKVSFTGSVATGRAIAEQAASRLIPTTLELGGKSPIIVFPDVDIEDAVQKTIIGMRFSRQGQSCTSTTRILVHASIREKFLEALGAAVSDLVVGDPLDEDTDIGALISREQVDRVAGYVHSAVEEGIEIRELNQIRKDLQPGCFLPATLIIDPPQESSVVQDEIFGPVVTVHSWTSPDEVAALANGTDFGLSACILTDSSSQALTLARRLQAGFVQVNSGMVIQAGLSFGGYKSSGVGREASLDAMLEAFTQVKTIIIDHGGK